MTDLDRIKSSVNLAALVGQSFELTGQGRYLKAKQHDSLVVDTQQQAYFWNSKNETGDAIDWAGRHCLGYNGTWSSHDPTLFKEAICWLARWAKLPEPQFRPEDTAARAERLSRERLLTQAAEHYRLVLLRDDIQGYNYAAELRGFTPQTIAGGRLGYSDGALLAAIAEADRPTAATLGLIYQNERGQWRDAIPRGCLVYIHRARGQVVYLSARAIAEKRHWNQCAPKQMFWADWPGFGPLVIVEGQADALSVAQLGTSSLGLCGVNLADFDPDFVRLYNPVYIWPDADKPDTANLISAVVGPLIRVISSPPGLKDANDYLRAGHSPADFQNLLKTASTWLDGEILRLADLTGADRYDAIEPVFRQLAKLSLFELNIYRSIICKALDLSQSDFNRFLKAAKGTLSEDEEAEFSKGGQYCLVDGWTVLKTFDQEGKPKIMSLANASVKITEEISLDDGSNEPELDYVVDAELATGQKLPQIQVPSVEFGSMKWTARWGCRFIISAGRNTQDHFRTAVQHLSGSPKRRTIYTHTGWRKIDGQNYFLSSTGALGSADNSIQVDLRLGRPDTHMVRYQLPTPENISEAMQASLKFWYICDLSVTIPIWASMFLAPLTPFLAPDFGLWVHGQTGSMKSSMVAAALAHFGQWQGKDAKSFLPSNFQSTSNAILLNAFQSKDVPLVIDDFAPGATQKEMRERDATASNLLRSIGNKSARGRMKDGRHFQADFPPRCLAIITAEDLPPTASIMARGLGVRVHIPPRGDPARRPIEQRLTQAQNVDSYQYPHAMAGFLMWVQRHWAELQTDLPTIASRYRDQLQSAGHARLPDAFGKLMAAIDTALYFAMDCGAITDSQAKERQEMATQSMGMMLNEHGEAVDSVDACRIFQEVLREHLDARLWYICRVDADCVTPPENSPIGSTLVGYYDDACLYLLTKTVTDIMTSYQRLGTPFPVGRNTLYRRLIEKGWLIPSEKATDTVYIQAMGTSPRVLKLLKREILPD